MAVTYKNHADNTELVLPISACQILEKAALHEQFLPTGTCELDQRLRGGILTGEVTEIYGLPGTGKTQFCLSVAASTSVSLKYNVLYIDTKNCFSEQRVAELVQERCTRKGDPTAEKDALSRIAILRALDMFSLLRYLYFVEHQLQEQTEIFYSGLKLIIIDSVAAVALPNIGGNQMQGQALLAQFSILIRKIASDHSVAVVAVNNATQKLDENPNRTVVPALGRVWFTTASVRIFVDSLVKNLKVVKSNR